MGGAGLGLCGMSPEQKPDPVVQRCHIGNADEQMSSDTKRPRHFMHYPEKFLRMLKNLVGNDNVDGLRRKRKALPLQIKLIRSAPRRGQQLDIRRITFQSQGFRTRKDPAGHSQISSPPLRRYPEQFQRTGTGSENAPPRAARRSPRNQPSVSANAARRCRRKTSLSLSLSLWKAYVPPSVKCRYNAASSSRLSLCTTSG